MTNISICVRVEGFFIPQLVLQLFAITAFGQRPTFTFSAGVAVSSFGAMHLRITVFCRLRSAPPKSRVGFGKQNVYMYIFCFPQCWLFILPTPWTSAKNGRNIDGALLSPGPTFHCSWKKKKTGLCDIRQLLFSENGFIVNLPGPLGAGPFRLTIIGRTGLL